MNAIVKPNAPVTALRPQTFDQLVHFAEMAARSKMVPPAFQGEPESIMLAIQMGSEIGLAPMQALQNIAVVNGRPAVWGDAVVGLCRQSPVCQDIVETVTGEGDAMVATCVATRVGAAPVSRSFSVEDAKRAGLWKTEPKTKKFAKDGRSYEVDSGPWYSYPKRMLQMRARGFAVRDAFPDVLRGLITAEEARDIPPHNGPTIEHEPEPRQEPPASKPEAKPEAKPEPKRTIASALDALEARLRDCADNAAVDAILAEPDTQRLAGFVTNGALTRFDAMFAAARAAHAPVTHDDPFGEADWPGDPAEMRETATA